MEVWSSKKEPHNLNKMKKSNFNSCFYTKLLFSTLLIQAQNFFSSLGAKGSQMRIVQEATETIKQNMRWMEKNLDTLQHWL